MVLLVTVSGEGLAQLVPITAYILSGLVVPMPLLPPALQSVLNFLPFRGVMDTPLRLWSGHLPASELPYLLAHQLAWTLVLSCRRLSGEPRRTAATGSRARAKRSR